MNVNPSNITKLEDVEKYIKHSWKKGTENLKGANWLGKVVKNLTNTISVKFDRIVNKIKTGEWINNKSIREKIKNNINHINEDLKKECDLLDLYAARYEGKETPEFESFYNTLNEGITDLAEKINDTKSVIKSLIKSETKTGKATKKDKLEIEELISTLKEVDKKLKMTRDGMKVSSPEPKMSSEEEGAFRELAEKMGTDDKPPSYEKVIEQKKEMEKKREKEREKESLQEGGYFENLLGHDSKIDKKYPPLKG